MAAIASIGDLALISILAYPLARYPGRIHQLALAAAVLASRHPLDPRRARQPVVRRDEQPR